MLTQMQIYEKTRRAIADANQTFLEMVQHPTNPLTRADLEALIARRPHVYGRFAGWLSKLR